MGYSLYQLETICSRNHYVKQLYSLKRCFGGHASIGFADGSYASSIKDLVNLDIIRRWEWIQTAEEIDPYLQIIPRTHEELNEHAMVYLDTECPNKIAQDRQESARKRAEKNRERVRKEHFNTLVMEGHWALFKGK